jgi:DNA mismatch endonuclease (patch repair protein)
MPDNLSKEQRSYCMSQVKGKDTSLERLTRSALHHRGYRFRKHMASLPGKPDIVFPKQRVAVFVDGDFWHGWRFPSWRRKLSPWWQKKIEATRKRDQRNIRQLRSKGWLVIRIWEHQLKNNFRNAIDSIAAEVDSQRGT